MGEPMLHPDLPEIVAHAESRGVADRAQHELRPHHRGADRRRSTARRPHQPDPLLPDPGPRDASRPARPPSSSSTSTATRSASPSSARSALGARTTHRDRHHEHEARRRLPHRQRGRAGPRLPRGLDRLLPGAGGAVRPRAARSTTGRRSAARTSSTRTRTAAATRSSTASTSSGSAATPGAT